MKIHDIEIILTGRFIKTVRIKEEWYEDVEDPASFLEHLRRNKIKGDIFTFWQRLPDTIPKYKYYMEYAPVAAVRIESYEHWLRNQISRSARKAISKAEKSNIIVKLADFNDEFVRGVVGIFNETPIRQGRPYTHYGKDLSAVKNELSSNIERCSLIGAYLNDELIGFIQLGFAGKYVVPFGMVSKIEHRDKSPQNALIAKAVEVCQMKDVPYLLYGYWGSGSLNDFKRHCGCEEINLPRYYIPLSLKGKIALKLRLHHGISEKIPEKLKDHLVALRAKWYSKKYNINN
jgi:hypothetical protein